ncbi:MAG TPA: DUF4411 family protein, partial [Chitinophagaceae bacterium]|nr:DUF4411 family protein [Chitinophagaceae bacterium]
YPLDVAHSFWNKVSQLAHEQKIISIDKVKKEIYDHEDALRQWCIDNLPADFFKDTTTVLAEYGRVAAWVGLRSNHYLPNALAEFLHADEADAHIIAYTLADTGNRIIVTQETSEPNRRNKVKIPEPCNALSVQYCNTIEMFRRLGETF